MISPIILQGFDPFPERNLNVSLEVPEIKIDLPQFTVASSESTSVEAE